MAARVRCVKVGAAIWQVSSGDVCGNAGYTVDALAITGCNSWCGHDKGCQSSAQVTGRGREAARNAQRVQP